MGYGKRVCVRARVCVHACVYVCTRVQTHMCAKGCEEGNMLSPSLLNFRSYFQTQVDATSIQVKI